jgi:putative ABC transport system substrate-binding protein
MIHRRGVIGLVGGAAATWRFEARAQPQALPRVGVIFQGGPWEAVIDGLREGLDQLGFAEGKQFVLSVRDTRGDRKAVEEAAKDFEQQKVDVIYTAATSVSVAARNATMNTPIVFVAGTDPVAVGRVESIRRPGGRLTGIHLPVTYVTGKRLELLREIVPNLHRVVTFYDPRSPTAIEFANEAREAAQRLGLELIERHVASVAELKKALQGFRAGEADAYFAASDAMVDTQARSIIDMAKAKRLPTMFYLQGVVEDGGLASYSPDFKEAGRLSAKYVRRILAGTVPGELPVEQSDRLVFMINLKTAKEIGLAIPESMLIRADKVIE